MIEFQFWDVVRCDFPGYGEDGTEMEVVGTGKQLPDGRTCGLLLQHHDKRAVFAPERLKLVSRPRTSGRGGQEWYLDGALYDPKGECRTDVYLKEVPGRIVEGLEYPTILELILCNGNLHLSLVETLPKDVVRLGKFLQEVAQDVINREAVD